MQTKKNWGKTHLFKDFTLRNPKDIIEIKRDIEKNMIIIIRITPLAQRDVEELKMVVEDLYKSVTIFGGDIARLGEERIIITPPGKNMAEQSRCIIIPQSKKYATLQEFYGLLILCMLC
ncbi:MAG: cell division protein SepF [Candidatus Nitrosocosmicus sp.]|nr:cell division protein SepF [Candidatus Nitrosocosmicus sp.]